MTEEVICMTKESMIKALDEKKYNIIYYIYFISCLLVAVLVADPINVVSALV